MRPLPCPLLEELAGVSPYSPRPDNLTVCLYPNIHLGLGGMRDRVGAEFNIRATVPHVSISTNSPTSKDSNLLLHNSPSQRVPKGVPLLNKLERGGGISRAGKLTTQSAGRPRSKECLQALLKPLTILTRGAISSSFCSSEPSI